MKNKTTVASDTWLSPRAFYQQLNSRFHFDPFDPAPPDNNIEEFDGLSAPWAQRNYINPPYSQELKEKFLYKGYSESLQGKLVVFLLPVSTSTKIFHELILPNAKIEFLRGRLGFEGVDTRGNWVNPNTGMGKLKDVPENAPQIKQAGQNDLMLAIFGQE
jgi:DNA N-6-adenine-methyltransferase (Dam)